MLKTKTITTDKATLLVCELPECRGVVSDNQGKRICFHTEKGWDWIWQPNGMFGKLKLLGRLPDITEGYVYELIPEVITPIMGFKAYPNFDKDGYCKTALESLYSLLKANEVYFENPLGKLHPTHPAYTGEGTTVKEWLEKCKKWGEAQSKVWDRERTYILTKVD